MKDFIKKLTKYYGKDLLALAIEIAIIASQPVKTVTSIDMQGQGLQLTAVAWGAIILMMITVGTIAAKIENNILANKAKKAKKVTFQNKVSENNWFERIVSEEKFN